MCLPITKPTTPWNRSAQKATNAWTSWSRLPTKSWRSATIAVMTAKNEFSRDAPMDASDWSRLPRAEETEAVMVVV